MLLFSMTLQAATEGPENQPAKGSGQCLSPAVMESSSGGHCGSTGKTLASAEEASLDPEMATMFREREKDREERGGDWGKALQSM